MKQIAFSSFPRNVRLGIIFTLCGWVFLILSQAALTSTISLLTITLALASGVMVYSLKPWCRVLCIILGLLIAGVNVYLFMKGLSPAGGLLSSLVHLINAVLFCLATFSLMSRDAASFYKLQSGSPQI
jgi:SNF family Na+-dependent transporter